MINILLWMGCSIKSTVELQNTKKAYQTAQVSIYGDFYEDVVRNERVPNSVKKYINREVIYELSYAKSQMQKSWEEYTSAEYQSSMVYAELAQNHIDRALELHQKSKPVESLQEESTEQLSETLEAEEQAEEQVEEQVEENQNSVSE